MKPAPFTYHRPGTVDEAVGLLARYGAEASPLAGGQSLVPMMNFRMARPEHLVDLNGIAELSGIKVKGGRVRIGAMMRHHRVATADEIRAHLPLVAHAAGTIGHFAIRQRGTLGGSLVQADPAGQLPLVAVALDAEVVVHSEAGARQVPVAEFLVFAMEVALEEGELVTAVEFPCQAPDVRWAFELFSRRHGDYAMASVAVAWQPDASGAVSGLRLAVGATAPVPHRLRELEQAQEGVRPDAQWCARLAREIAAAAEAEDDPKTPEVYRRELLATLAERALRRAMSGEGS
jgi:carbon-monoxide dehydrogenase medium subunit